MQKVLAMQKEKQASRRAGSAIAAYWCDRFERRAREGRREDYLTLAGVVVYLAYVVARVVIGGAV